MKRWNKAKVVQEGWADIWLHRETGLLNHFQKARKCLVRNWLIPPVMCSDALCLDL